MALGLNTGMCFLTQMTCNEVQNVEFVLDFKVLIKIGGVMMVKLKVKQVKM